MQGIEQRAGRELRRLRELPAHVLGADRLHVGDLASSSASASGEIAGTRVVTSLLVMALDSFPFNMSSPVRFSLCR